MKVLIIASGIAGETPDLAGGDMRFIEIAKHWSEMGVEVHVCTPKGGEHLCRELGLDFIPHCVPKSRSDGRLQAIFDTMLLPFRVPRSVWDFDGEVVYSVNEQLYDIIPALFVKLKRGKSIRWATVVHWLPPFLPWKRKSSRPIHSLLFFFSERSSVLIADHFADTLLAVSTSTKGQLQQAGAKMHKVHAVECGVPLAAIEAIAQQQQAKIYDAVFMKRIQRVKGAYDLVPIWEKVLEAKPDAKLLLIGYGEDANRLQEIVRKKGLTENIVFAGLIYDFEKKFSLLSQARLFLLPSYEENWAIAIGEAMAAGIPVVAYSLEELIQVWGDNFVQIPIGNTDRFAEIVVELLQNDQKMQEISAKACQFVQRLDWTEIAKRELSLVTGEAG
jgi:glycosyltransferase involved in cell wall biosynthesis